MRAISPACPRRRQRRPDWFTCRDREETRHVVRRRQRGRAVVAALPCAHVAAGSALAAQSSAISGGTEVTPGARRLRSAAFGSGGQRPDRRAAPSHQPRGPMGPTAQPRRTDRAASSDRPRSLVGPTAQPRRTARAAPSDRPRSLIAPIAQPRRTQPHRTDREVSSHRPRSRFAPSCVMTAQIAFTRSPTTRVRTTSVNAEMTAGTAAAQKSSCDVHWAASIRPPM